MGSGRLRRLLGVLGLVVGGVVATLAVAEAAARILWTPPRAAAPSLRPERQELPDVRTRHGLARPNLRVRNAGALFETNSEGFRGREVPRAKPAGAFRIALIGDSFAMGWGVKEAETYAARVERALNARGAGAREVLNFGLAGLDAAGAVDRFEELALLFDPDLAVYGFTLNDIEGRHYRKTTPHPDDLTFAIVESPFQLTLWSIVGPRFHALAEVLWAPRGSYVDELDENYFRNPPAWADTLEALDRLAAAAREREICALVLIHTRLHYLNAWHPYRRHYEAIAQAAAARGLPRFHRSRPFWGARTASSGFFPGMPTPGPRPTHCWPRCCWRAWTPCRRSAGAGISVRPRSSRGRGSRPPGAGRGAGWPTGAAALRRGPGPPV